MPIITNCEVCNKEIKSYPSRIRKYCSRECTGKAKSNQIIKKCIICSKEFETPKSSSLKRKTCSTKCLGIYNSKRLDNNLYKTCKNCGKEFKVKPSHYDRRKTCSRECAHIIRNKENNNTIGSWTFGKKGKEHPGWMGGKRIHTTKGYVYIRQEDGTEEAEHRIVAEKYFGKKLANNEIVHHIDGNKINNEPYNLQILTLEEHTTLHRELEKLNIDISKAHDHPLKVTN